MDLRKKVAVVTGSSTGVGRATAVKLASKGCNVVFNFNRSIAEAEEVRELCQAEGSAAIVVHADVATGGDCRRLIQSAIDEFHRLDVLVNNAAVTEFVRFEDLDGLTEEMWLRIFRTNVLGAFFCARAAVPHMKRSGEGVIVNVSSIAGIQGSGSSIAYASSKAAVINMTKCLARSLGPEIRVNAVARELLTPTGSGTELARLDSGLCEISIGPPLRCRTSLRPRWWRKPSSGCRGVHDDRRGPFG
jgi:3-oxoacyl-[acyl-carrier protein] reductase